MIISVGNISLGGTGKTPFVILIGKYFLKQAKKVCVLSRGYKGQIGYNTNVISDGKSILLKPPLAADEPYLIAENLKDAVMITGKDRTQGYKKGLRDFGCEIFILDDGFQHKKMKRDVDILLLDYHKPISNGLIFPFGYLREFPSAISRADIVVFTKSDKKDIPIRVKKYVKNKPVFFSNYKFTEIVSENDKKKIDDLNGIECIAFSGIANNSHFFSMLQANNFNLIKTFSFPDHHIYKEKELEKIISIAKNKIIVTTEKDYVKIPDNLKDNFYYCKIEIVMDDLEGFFKKIEEIYKKKQP